jgi:hypothetical protein
MRIKHGEFIAPNVQEDVITFIPEDAGQYEWIDGKIQEVSEPEPDHGDACARVSMHLGR